MSEPWENQQFVNELILSELDINPKKQYYRRKLSTGRYEILDITPDHAIVKLSHPFSQSDIDRVSDIGATLHEVYNDSDEGLCMVVNF